jgi:hypothetical protein
MDLESKLLGQLRPANNTAASLYAPAGNKKGFIEVIVVCNTTANPETFRVFYDSDGTTYSQVTALYYDFPIDPNETFIISFEGLSIPITSAGNLAVRTSTGDALNFTAFGKEK